MTPIPKPQLVLFDCDGVLVDSETITNKVLQADLADRGLDMRMDEIMRLFVGGTMVRTATLIREKGVDLPDDWVNRIYEKMYAALRAGTPVIDGVVAVLDALDRDGIPYAVVSNGAEEKMGITLGQHPALWERLRTKLYSAYTYGTAKPEPDLFLRAAKDAGVRPGQCVAIDDSPSGCTGAVRAGMPCLGFAEHDDGQRLSDIGATVVHSMADAAAAMGLSRATD